MGKALKSGKVTRGGRLTASNKLACGLYSSTSRGGMYLLDLCTGSTRSTQHGGIRCFSASTSAPGLALVVELGVSPSGGE